MFERPTPVSDPIATLAALLAKGTKFFKVRFVKRTTGEERVMLCRRAVKRYVTGTGAWSRLAEDMEHQVLTVWDVEKFHELRKSGKGLDAAGRASFRRIPLDGVLEISGVDHTAISPAHTLAA